MAEKILEMKAITKRFPGVLALDKVTFDAYPGEILALCGENGAGKSTLMKVLSGTFPRSQYEGEIWINGEKQDFNTPGDSERAGIAMIYQEISMHLDSSIAENLFLGHLFLNKYGFVDWKKINEEAKKLLAQVGMDIDPTIKLRTLGASQQQLVAIARALSKNPKILVLDEPTSPLTQGETVYLFKILHELRDKGIACLLITHKMDEVFENSDRVTILRDGKTVGSYITSEVTREQVVAGMVGREITDFYPKEKAEIGDVVLDVKDVTVAHPYIPGRNIVENASFNVRAGEILGVAGLVGAGRSELLNGVFGALHRKSGQIFLEGKEVDIKSPEDAIKLGMALATEDRKKDGVFLSLNIQQNIAAASLREFANNGWMDAKREREASKAIFDRLAIRAPGLDTRVGALSGGNQQKVVLAKWLVKHPKVLILDEPTRGIDVGAKAEIYRIMVELAKEGVAIIMISSELPELLAMSDRIMVIAGGEVKGFVDAEEATSEKVMAMAT